MAAIRSSRQTDIREWMKYLRQHPRVTGMLEAPDPFLMATILHEQTAAGVTGDILEIGTYSGKTAILLGFGLCRDEVLHVCDPFEYWHFGNDPKLGQSHFLWNYKRFHPTPPDVFVGLSRDFHGKEKSYRFVHIDGSHTFNDVVDDIQMVRDLCTQESVIVIDDYSHPRFPGIAAATWASVQRGELTPFCLTPNKFYATREPGLASEWRKKMLAALGDVRGWRIREDAIAGSEPLLVIRESFSLRGVAHKVAPQVAVAWWRKRRWRLSETSTVRSE